jgi:hypothetical protein
VGGNAGNYTQGFRGVAIGQGCRPDKSRSICYCNWLRRCRDNQSVNSIVLNASGADRNGAAAGFYVDPIRSTTSSARPVVYDSGTKELFYTSTLEFINSTISTSDSQVSQLMYRQHSTQTLLLKMISR